MQILWRSILSLCRRVGSARPRSWWPAIARRHTQLVALSSAHPNHHSRSWSMQPHLCIPYTCSTAKCMDASKMTKKATQEATDNFTPTLVGRRYANGVWFPFVYKNSTHRDGAIYDNMVLQEDYFESDITDHTETRLEPMMFSEAWESCLYHRGSCRCHYASPKLQFFSVTLAQSSITNGSIQLYGYIAVRDERDYMLNYILNYSRDDPITVKQGSLIEMTGPKRAICMLDTALLEFDMRIINGEQEDSDLQLIDGAMTCRYLRPWKPVINRIVGDCGAVDMTFAYIELGIEATIELSLSVPRDFDLSLSSFIYIMEKYEEIQLFHGSSQGIGQRRFVVAVPGGTEMQLEFKFGNDNARSYRTSFHAMAHGYTCQEITLELGYILVKVTWSTVHY